MSRHYHFIDSTLKWIKDHIAFARFIGVIGIVVSCVELYEEYHVKPRIEFWHKNQQTLSDVRLKAEEINDLCLRMITSSDKDEAFAEITRLAQENLDYIDRIEDLNFSDYKIRPETQSELKKFLKWNYENYEEIISTHRCPSEKMSSSEIENKAKKIQNMISKDMNWP